MLERVRDPLGAPQLPAGCRWLVGRPVGGFLGLREAGGSRTRAASMGECVCTPTCVNSTSMKAEAFPLLPSPILEPLPPAAPARPHQDLHPLCLPSEGHEWSQPLGLMARGAARGPPCVHTGLTQLQTAAERVGLSTEVQGSPEGASDRGSGLERERGGLCFLGLQLL